MSTKATKERMLGRHGRARTGTERNEPTKGTKKHEGEERGTIFQTQPLGRTQTAAARAAGGSFCQVEFFSRKQELE